MSISPRLLVAENLKNSASSKGFIGCYVKCESLKNL
jgi:hypothetical protein